MSKRVRNTDALREECLRLRREQRLSYDEIQRRTGASKGSLSNWLRNEPLKSDELQDRQRCRRRDTGPKPGTKAWTERRESTLARLMGERIASSQTKGRVAEAAVVARLAALGYATYGGDFDGQRVDVVAECEKTGRLLKVQVKHVQEGKHGWPCILLRRSGGRGKSVRYADGEFDVLVGYDAYSDMAFVFMETELKGISKSVSASEESLESWDKLATFLDA